ncbi:MAG TPA: alpha/beta fold hydrolase [Dehalococcoidia bacterium]|nr:alpha/beta fold hydrolase [Dehalococcoidia bacterium]
MQQDIRFCTAPDGVRIAYATVGSGYPLVVSQGWLSHLELDWGIDHMRRFWETLAERHLVVRYDKRGTGLSDRKVSDYSLGAQVGDLAAVVEALNVRRLAVMGYSQGGPISIAYAHGHQEIVSHLVLYGTYASGKYTAISELAAALNHLIEADWGGMGSLALSDIYLPGVSAETRQEYARYQLACAEKDAALAQATSVGEFSVKALLHDVSMPALVIHKKGDKPVPFELGRRLARDLPNSRFIPLEGDMHALTIGSTRIVLEAMLDFLGGATVGAPVPERVSSTNGIITRREKDVLRLIAAGKSNRRIAEELSISVNTADRHVSNILTKIAASNRAEAASYAVRAGIAS